MKSSLYHARIRIDEHSGKNEEEMRNNIESGPDF